MKRSKGKSINPWIKVGGAQNYTSRTNSNSNAVPKQLKDVIGEGVKIEKLTPGTQEYCDAEKELEYQDRQKKNRQDEIESRGNRLVIGKIIAEKTNQPAADLDPKTIEEFKKEIQRKKINKEFEINKNIEKTLYDNINHNDIQNRLNGVKDLFEIDFANEYAWENNMPIFLKSFERWLDYNPEPEDIEQVSRDFGELMIKASQVNLANKKMQEFNKIKNQFCKALSELLNYKDILDEFSLECLEKIEELEVMKNQTKIYTISESEFIKKNIQNALCEFLNIRNRIVKQEHLLMVIRNLPQDKFEIKN